MAHEINIPKNTNQEATYQLIVSQIEAMCSTENNIVANLANVSALLKEVFEWFWVGFYLVEGEELVLGPFQGSVACSRIPFGRGVCGKAWQDRSTIIVDDVEKFEGHIACSSRSRSEIVVPIISQGQMVALLDVDSEKIANFDDTDRDGLEKVCEYLATIF